MFSMKELIISDGITYDGTQLASHWAFRQYGLQGDSIVAFQGPCRVALPALVDLADVRENAPIYSENMLHFIVEHFTLRLEQTILRQRLLIATLKDIVTEKTGASLTRRGDDLFTADRKLTVSIATLTPVSTMIHTGINITGRNAPVPAIGLADLGLNQQEVTEVGQTLCRAYVTEYEQIKLARCKVRGVE
jgi:hypothetical protein